MDLVVFPREELQVALRALAYVTQGNGVFTDAERDFVGAIAHVHGEEVDVDRLDPISVDEVAACIVDPHRRKRLVQLALIASLVEAEPEQATANAVRELAAGLAVEEKGLEVLQEVIDGQLFVARLDMLRRLRPAMLGDDAGLPGVLKMALPFLGLGGDPRLAQKYKALGALPEGTFGRAFHDHYVDHGFAFPGDKNGIPARGTFHDAGHVLSGYDVSPAGEIQQAAFQAGFMRRDGFVVLMFGILQFHLGLRITPIAKGERGYFDVKKVVTAAQRGSACSVDLSDGWDLFSVADVPLETLRARYGVPPLVA